MQLADPVLLNGSALAKLCRLIAWSGFLFIGILVFFYMPWQLTQAISPAAVAGIGIGSAGFSLWLALKICKLPAIKRLPCNSAIGLIIAALVAGVFVRVVWLLIVPPVQLSDALDYWNAALRLLETGTYSYGQPGRELYAWRPPGYPFFLAAFIAAFGSQPWIPAATNITLYVLTSLVVVLISRRLSGYASAVFAVSLLAIWPSLIFLTGLAFNEPLSMFLFTLSFFSFIEAEQRGWLCAAACGVLTGLGALVRPVLLALPVLWIGYVLMKNGGRGLSIQLAGLAIISMALIIAPWTVRNYRVLGAPVLISTNGGDVFYRANNPLASGGFSSQGAKNLAIYKTNELLWNRMGYDWGLQWIKENPVAFLKLAVKKQGILLGEDETGVYWSLGRGHGFTGAAYKALAALSNIWWSAIWILSIIGLVRARHFFWNDQRGALLLLMVLFFVAVHSVFESQPRYHLPFLGLLSVVASFALYPPAKQSKSVESLEI
jgi:4-amino-4-deoxy-L-arabinose transferase-like glycosyltransferase